MNHSPEFEAFEQLVDSVLAVPHEEIKRREAECRQKAQANPRKRGPKRKAKRGAQAQAGGD